MMRGCGTTDTFKELVSGHVRNCAGIPIKRVALGVSMLTTLQLFSHSGERTMLWQTWPTLSVQEQQHVACSKPLGDFVVDIAHIYEKDSGEQQNEAFLPVAVKQLIHGVAHYHDAHNPLGAIQEALSQLAVVQELRPGVRKGMQWLWFMTQEEAEKKHLAVRRSVAVPHQERMTYFAKVNIATLALHCVCAGTPMERAMQSEHAKLIQQAAQLQASVPRQAIETAYTVLDQYRKDSKDALLRITGPYDVTWGVDKAVHRQIKRYGDAIDPACELLRQVYGAMIAGEMEQVD